MDLFGPFSIAVGGVKWLIVTIDYFTKWIEAEALAIISTSNIRRFFYRKIICRFGVLHSIINDNGTQFLDKMFNQVLQDLHIKHRTTPHSTTGETPFCIVCGSEAMIPVEIGEPSWRKMYATEESNSQALLHNLDTINEMREIAHIKEAVLKQRITTCYNSKVIKRSFNVGELVLRRADIGNKNGRQGKLATNWEGPYRVQGEKHEDYANMIHPWHSHANSVNFTLLA
ncbi:uncharacterized protein LOC133296546 [Gastrolobium bilobum]|uniref:uncharacterized protein LOC133296546 n=1 Tax=Gastrolobium bilobum TaxID=150636 RepID=UPI002AB115D0|nr:uncharacterized protein LOC133296546 [Gastrolobium bilobum]